MNTSHPGLKRCHKFLNSIRRCLGSLTLFNTGAISWFMNWTRHRRSRYASRLLVMSSASASASLSLGSSSPVVEPAEALAVCSFRIFADSSAFCPDIRWSARFSGHERVGNLVMLSLQEILNTGTENTVRLTFWKWSDDLRSACCIASGKTLALAPQSSSNLSIFATIWS